MVRMWWFFPFFSLSAFSGEIRVHVVLVIVMFLKSKIKSSAEGPGAVHNIVTHLDVTQGSLFRSVSWADANPGDEPFLGPHIVI